MTKSIAALVLPLFACSRAAEPIGSVDTAFQ